MVKCSLCGAIGTNKTSCPLNPDAKNPDRSKHNVGSAASGTATYKPSVASGSGSGSSKTLVKPKVPSTVVKPKVPSTVVKPKMVTPKVSVAGATSDPYDMSEIIKEAEQLWPGNKTEQDIYVAAYLDVVAPRAGVKYSKISKELIENCDKCYNYIKLRNMQPKPGGDFEFYNNTNTVCQQCAQLIANQYHKDVSDGITGKDMRYKKNYKGRITPELTLRYGKGDGKYFNQAMHDGAVFWADIAASKAVANAPVPKRR